MERYALDLKKRNLFSEKYANIRRGGDSAPKTEALWGFPSDKWTT